MRISRPPAGFLVQRLIVPQPKGIDAQQSRRRLAHDRMERERANRGRIFPQVDALDERLFVRRLLAELAVVEALAPRHRFIDGGAVTLEFVHVEQVGHHDETVAPELHGIRCDFVRQGRNAGIHDPALLLQHATRARHSQNSALKLTRSAPA